MPKIKYVYKKFQSGAEIIIRQANKIIEEFQSRGFVLTVRQLYYQFVSRGLMENTVRNYAKLARIISEGRLAGLVDWLAIEDRTRGVDSISHWSSTKDIIGACERSYYRDKWRTQPFRVEVWIEKEALAGVFEGVCHELDIPFLCCRGYTSQSEMWRAAMRLKAYTAPNPKGPSIRIPKKKTFKTSQDILILHFGDHDPSGMDMTRDITQRLITFGLPLKLERMALNTDQVRQYRPPPNPAKETDSRFVGYMEKYGDKSWELDALDPQVLAQLVRGRVQSIRDKKAWAEELLQEQEERELLKAAFENWDSVKDHLETL